MRTTARRVVVASAVYDLVVTAPFALAGGSAFVLELMRSVHTKLALPGAQLPAFAPTHVFFVGLLGSVVTMWSVARLLRPSPFLGVIDGITRLLFSGWMVWGLAHGESFLLAGFLVPELSFGLLQLGLCWRTRTQESFRDDHADHHPARA